MRNPLINTPSARTAGTARPARWVLAGLTIAFCSSTLFVTGCSDEDDEVVATVRKKRDERKEKQVQPTAAANNEIGYVYNAQNKRDPFKSYFEELAVSEKEQRNLSELQRFELGSLKLVAVVAGTATPMALLEDPSGKGHTIKIGTLLGKKFGQVKQIRRGEVDVQEEYRDFTGRRIKTMTTLKLVPEGEIE